MYEKIGLALTNLKKWELHIVGFCSQSRVRSKNIVFHPMFHFERMSVRRFFAPIRFLKKILQLKPEVIVINSPDLLIVTIVYKILFGKKVVYDVLENYQANVLFANTFPMFARRFVASGVRLTEWMTRPFVDEYWLAERVYERELPFTKGKFRLLENRFPAVLDVVVKPRRGMHKLLYSGTIAESYGVFDAIALAKALHSLDNRFRLTIIGYAAQLAVRDQLYKEANECDFIDLIGIHAPVPHNQIFKAIQKADVGLLPYRINRATIGRIPTKFYEYLAFSLPFIVSPNLVWEDYLGMNNPVMFYDFQCLDCTSLYEWLITDKSLVNTTNNRLDYTYYTIIFSNLSNKSS